MGTDLFEFWFSDEANRWVDGRQSTGRTRIVFQSIPMETGEDRSEVNQSWRSKAKED